MMQPEETFRYSTSGTWLKGNVHLHSTVSDGGKTFAELAEMYAAAGFDFLFRTDHWALSTVADDPSAYPLLWLDGVELDGEDSTGSLFHVLCLGTVSDIRREDGLAFALQAARRQGALLVLAHPHWCGNTLEDVLRWQFDGVEVYNHVCHWLNGKSNGLVHWDAALRRDARTLAFAVDDAHLRPEHPGWNGGWIAVNAPERSPQAIMDAIRSGNYYSSCGPQIHAIDLEGDELHLVTSPVKFVRLVGPRHRGARIGSFENHLHTDVRMTVPRNWDYVYLELEDDSGRRAWTNTLFI